MGSTATSSASLPLRFGSEAQFTALREGLREAGFTEQHVLERLKIANLGELLSRMHSVAPPSTGDLLDLLTSVLVVGRSIERESFERVAPRLLQEALAALGVLADEPGRIGHLCSPVALYPFAGLLIVSDRWSKTDGSVMEGPEDCVYPAITRNTQFFLSTLPATPCEALLELCSGTAVAALAGASYAKRAWALDITERSTVMADFSRRLNGIANATILQSDLYAAVSGLTFDRIIAHPPYMPVLRPGYVFYDGGEDGERLTRSIVNQLPAFLRPGGTCYIVAMGADNEEEPVEKRIRSWLGSGGDDFDVAFIVKRLVEPDQFATDASVRSRGGVDELTQWLHFFRERHIRDLALGQIVIYRHEKMRAAFTARRQRSSHTGPAEVAWLMKYESAAAASVADEIATARPVLSPRMELSVIHRVEKNSLDPARFVASTDYPFNTDCVLEPWAAMLLSACGGNSTVRQLFEIAGGNGVLPPNATFTEFAEYVRTLIAGGFLVVKEYPLPRLPG